MAANELRGPRGAAFRRRRRWFKWDQAKCPKCARRVQLLPGGTWLFSPLAKGERFTVVPVRS